MLLKLTLLLLFLDTFLLFFFITFLFFQAYNKNFCCSKFTFLLYFSIVFLLFQARILVILFCPVFIIPNSCSCCFFQLCSCCSKLVFKCCFSRLCYYCSKLMFECFYSQLNSSTPSSHFWYLKLDILRKNFHVAFNFLIFCFVF
jgi:hypothetical protein